LLQQLIGGGAPQDRAAQFGWPKRGGNYNNQDSRMAASLGAGLSGLNANPGSKFGAFAGGFGKSMAGGSAQDTANRKQDESEHKQEFAEDEKLTKLPFELGTAKAKMDLVNAQAKVWGAKVDQNGKLTLGTNEKMWQSPIGRQTMIDRPINTMMENEFKNVRRKYGADMSTSDAAKYEKDLETVRQKFEARRQELYKQYNITPEVAAKNKLAGTNAANAFDPHAIGGGKMTDEQFKQLVPPGAWFIPKPGATPVQRAQETVMDRLGDAHDQNEKAAQKDKDINDLERQQYYSDNNQAGTQ
jgi:hypothetical protein